MRRVKCYSSSVPIQNVRKVSYHWTKQQQRINAHTILPRCKLKDRKHYNVGINNPNYGKTFKMSEETKEKQRLAHLGKRHTEESKRKISLIHKGKKNSQETKERISIGKLAESNPMWKGDNVGRCSLHEWVTKRFPRTTLCQICNKIPPYDLANISGEYKRDLTDWQWLCRRCHMQSDGRISNLKQYKVS